MTRSLPSGFIRPCSSADAVLREDLLRQVIGHLGRRLEVDLLRLLDQRIDDVGLPARRRAAPRTNA